MRFFSSTVTRLLMSRQVVPSSLKALRLRLLAWRMHPSGVRRKIMSGDDSKRTLYRRSDRPRSAVIRATFFLRIQFQTATRRIATMSSMETMPIHLP